MPATLDQIVAARRRSVADAKASANMRELERAAAEHEPRGFRHALLENAQPGPAVIAELKKASPSRGVIRTDFRVRELAVGLEKAGASALSVLTEAEHFQGSLENLRIASQATSLPCLRKDFIVDEFQLLEARANRADAVLLICASLTNDELTNLYESSRDLGLDVLCEVHDASELKRAIDAGCDVIGVNSRDLRTFDVDLNTALRLGEEIPAGVVRVAESGIHTSDDVRRLRDAGFDALLVGESLMKAADPGAALRELLSGSAVEAHRAHKT